MNKLLMEENDRLQKQVSQLVYENGYMRQQLHNVVFQLHSHLISFLFSFCYKVKIDIYKAPFE